MRVRNTRAVGAAAIVSAVGLLLAACGDDSGGGDAATTTSAASVAAVETTPVVVEGAGDIGPYVADYQELLGPDNGGVPDQYESGRREINWDAVPDEFARPNAYPSDFFNAPEEPRARGIVLETSSGELGVSADSDNPDGAAVRFGDINPTYVGEFTTFSEERLFSPIRTNVVDAFFFVPGTDTPAVVRGFGAVYTDVDREESADFVFFDADDNSLGTFSVPVSEDGLSFLGVAFEEPIVARVRIIYGNVELGPDDDARFDVAVMDDFIFGEPQPQAAAASSLAVTNVAAGLSAGEATTYVTRVKRADASLGVVLDEHEAIAYLCDGAGRAVWFHGIVKDDLVVATAPSDPGSVLVAEVDGGMLRGRVVLADGNDARFAAGRAATPAGLYRERRTIDGVGYTAGWVVLANGETVGDVTVDRLPLEPEKEGTASEEPTPDEPAPDEPGPERPGPLEPEKEGPTQDAPAQDAPAPGDVADEAVAEQFPTDPPADAAVISPRALGTDATETLDGGEAEPPAAPETAPTDGATDDGGGGVEVIPSPCGVLEGDLESSMYNIFDIQDELKNAKRGSKLYRELRAELNAASEEHQSLVDNFFAQGCELT
jgi:hypothetical protein